MDQVDLSGFPVLRIDQIGRIDTETLRQANDEALELIGAMNAADEGGTKPPLLYYLQRQLEAVRRELATRSVQDRMDSMLESAWEAPQGNKRKIPDGHHGSEGISPREDCIVASQTFEAPTSSLRESITVRQPNARGVSPSLSLPNNTGSASTMALESESTTGHFKALPLPSEIARMKREGNFEGRQTVSSDMSSGPLNRVSISATLSASARNSEHANSGIDNIEDLPSKGAGAVSISGGGSGSATKGSRGRRRQSQSSTGTAGDVHTESNSIDDYNNDDTPSKRKDREKEKEKNSPTKKAMEVLYKNFSSEFIVAATERRVRFYPKKVVQETPEEVRERERAERRKVAMRRLMERREQQQARAEELRLKKRQDKIAKEAAEKAAKASGTGTAKTTKGSLSSCDESVGSNVVAMPSADAFDTESESESLSGDDVDAAAAAVEVDPVMLKNVERVVEKVSAAKVGVASKPHDDINTNGDAGEYSDRDSSGKAEKEKAAEGELGRSGRFGAVSKTHYKQPIAKRSKKAASMPDDRNNATASAAGGSSGGPARPQPKAAVPKFTRTTSSNGPSNVKGSTTNTTIRKTRSEGASRLSGADRPSPSPSRDAAEGDKLHGEDRGDDSDPSDLNDTGKPLIAESDFKNSNEEQAGRPQSIGSSEAGNSASSAESSAAATTDFVDTSSDRAHRPPSAAARSVSARVDEEHRVLDSSRSPATSSRSVHEHDHEHDHHVQSPSPSDAQSSRSNRLPILSNASDAAVSESLPSPSSSLLSASMPQSVEQKSMAALDMIRKMKMKKQALSASGNPEATPNSSGAIETGTVMPDTIVQPTLPSAPTSPRRSPRSSGRSGQPESPLASGRLLRAGSARRHRNEADDINILEAVEPDEKKIMTPINDVNDSKYGDGNEEREDGGDTGDDGEENEENAESSNEDDDLEESAVEWGATIEMPAINTEARAASGTESQSARLGFKNSANVSADTEDDDLVMLPVETKQLSVHEEAHEQEEAGATAEDSFRQVRRSKGEQTPRSQIVASRARIEQIDEDEGLLRVQNGVYTCSMGPDELPGLQAWSLVNVTGGGDAEWSLDLDVYYRPVPDDEETRITDPVVAKIRKTRAAARRSVSYGLILLVEECEALIRGTIRVRDAKHLSELWRAAVQRFDRYAESLSADEEENLFRPVETCGNCHAVCQKLENLAKMQFVFSVSKDDDDPGSNTATATSTGSPHNTHGTHGRSFRNFLSLMEKDSADQSHYRLSGRRSMESEADDGAAAYAPSSSRKGKTDYAAAARAAAAATLHADHETSAWATSAPDESYGPEKRKRRNKQHSIISSFSSELSVEDARAQPMREWKLESFSEPAMDPKILSSPSTGASDAVREGRKSSPFVEGIAARAIKSDSHRQKEAKHTTADSNDDDDDGVGSGREEEDDEDDDGDDDEAIIPQYNSLSVADPKPARESSNDSLFAKNVKATSDKLKISTSAHAKDERSSTDDIDADVLNHELLADLKPIVSDASILGDDDSELEKKLQQLRQRRDASASAAAAPSAISISAPAKSAKNTLTYISSASTSARSSEMESASPSVSGKSSDGKSLAAAPSKPPLAKRAAGTSSKQTSTKIARDQTKADSSSEKSAASSRSKSKNDSQFNSGDISSNISLTSDISGPSAANNVGGSSSNTSASRSRGPLLDAYEHIGMIFPLAYSAQGPRQADGLSARGLIESMQVQGKVYEEWLEVMGDYATVFSEDRGVPENVGGDGASSTVYNGGSRAYHYRVKASSRQEVYNIVTDVFNNVLTGWNELPSGLGLGLSWNVLWTWSKPRVNTAHLLVWQRLNHFEDSKQLTRKDLLKKNIQRYTDMTNKASDFFEIMPLTYLLPHEYTQFVKSFTEFEVAKQSTQQQNYWILKPVGLSRGRGIALIHDVSSFVYSQTSVVQKYVERPLCLDGYKFDLRLYVLVTSFRPLEAFIYEEGFARVSTHSYSLNPEDMSNKFIHLTNSSIQKQNAEGPTSDNPLMSNDEDAGGSKIALKGTHGLWQRLKKSGIDTDTVWKNICLLVLKSLVMVDDKMTYQPCAFEVFGYDVLIDADLRPWLIEVNASPSLARENPLDVRVKNAMIRDAILLLNPAPFDRAAVARILKRRLGDIAKNKFVLSRNDPTLEADLKDILGDWVPRKYGEDPAHKGDFFKLCPDTKMHQLVLKMKSKIIKS